MKRVYHAPIEVEPGHWILVDWDFSQPIAMRGDPPRPYRASVELWIKDNKNKE